MTKALGVVLMLAAAAALEAGGDAAIRQGLRSGVFAKGAFGGGASAAALKGGLVLLGGALLVGYSALLAQAPFDFGRVIGLYVGVFFVFGQILNLIVFRTPPEAGVWLGGVLIIAGAAVTVGLRPR